MHASSVHCLQVRHLLVEDLVMLKDTTAVLNLLRAKLSLAKYASNLLVRLQCWHDGAPGVMAAGLSRPLKTMQSPTKCS